MNTNFTLKDLTDISEKFDICTVANKYVVSACTNALEGEINAQIRIDSFEDGTVGKTVLFCFRSGEQICFESLKDEEPLRIPDDYLARIRESLLVEFEVAGHKNSLWRTAINRLNEFHSTDKNNNYEVISEDLPVPTFKYITPTKPSPALKMLRKLLGNVV